MKHFLNSPQRLVPDSLEGLIAASGGRLTRLDGFPEVKVVLRRDWDRSRVALISGGGSGHEPAHAGFVGDRMLTAAVAGEVFASPSVPAVLAAILAVTGPAGCLLIVKNYTGDRLSFGLAAEQARMRGLRVETVIVADDVALPDFPQPRGIAGTLLVHKIAGALAAQGRPLAEVAAAARAVADDVRSLGLALTGCHPPGHPEERLGPSDCELGLGIHGEPGVERIPLDRADELVARVLERLPDARGCAMLINDLGGVPPLEMGVVTRAVLRACPPELLIGPAPVMTSYDMNGFSISLLPLDELRRQALLAPTDVPSWPGAQVPFLDNPLAMPELTAPGHPPSAHPATEAALRAICRVLQESESDLNALDGRIGDGDTGSTLAEAARTIEANLVRLPLAEPALLLESLAHLTQGGSSGALLSIFLAAAGASGLDWLAALRVGLERVQEYGGARLGDRTALDALYPALHASEGGRARAAREGADRTATMSVARAGRASYVGAEHLTGVVDPGAEAVARVFAALGL